MTEIVRGRPIWIDVFRDTFCDLSVTAAHHLCKANLYNDENYRLVALHGHRQKPSPLIKHPSKQTPTKTLRIFNGTELEKEVIVKSTAGSLADVGNGLIAVAGGSSVYFFREMKPYFKFELKASQTSDALTDQEGDIWTGLKQGDVDSEIAFEQLGGLRNTRQLCRDSENFILCSTMNQRTQFLEENLSRYNVKARAFLYTDCITCLAVKKRESEAQGNLVLGTELGCVILLDDTATKEARRFDVGASVQFLCVVNQQYIIACTRNGILQCLNGMSTAAKSLTQLKAPCCGIVALGMKIFAACTTQEVHCFGLTGKKEYTMKPGAPIRSLIPMYIPSASAQCLLVLLQQGEILIYHRQNELHRITQPSPVAAIAFGRYGTEDCILTSVFKDGTLDMKAYHTLDGYSPCLGITGVLKRDFSVTPHETTESDPLCEAFVHQEQIGGESDHMHIIFQQQLQQLKLETIRAFTKLTMDGEGSFAENKHLNLQLNAEVIGLGPKFQIRLEMTNTGKELALQGLALCLSADVALYHLPRKYMKLPWLLNGQSYIFTIYVECTEEGERAPGDIRATVIKNGMISPLLCASIKMPVCQTRCGAE